MFKSKDKEGKGEKLTLKGYYDSLPKAQAPRSELIREVSERCGVDRMTARNWIVYGMRPRDERNIEVLSEITGISKEMLWG